MGNLKNNGPGNQSPAISPTGNRWAEAICNGGSHLNNLNHSINSELFLFDLSYALSLMPPSEGMESGCEKSVS